MNLFEKLQFSFFLKHLNIGKIDTLTGVEFEEFVADFFSYLGYKSELTKTSGDNGIDVVVKGRGYSVGIQTKLYYNHNVSNKAIQEVFTGKSYYKIDYAMAITNWKFSNPAKELAKELKVVIIDRNLLSIMIKNSRKDNKRLIKLLLKECVW